MDNSPIDDFLASQGVVIHQEGAEEVLEHFGVKGMHWGVRKSGDHENGAGGSTKETVGDRARAHPGQTVAATAGTAAFLTFKATHRPLLAVAAAAGVGYATHHALTQSKDFEQHVDHGKAFIANHPAVKK